MVNEHVYVHMMIKCFILCLFPQCHVIHVRIHVCVIFFLFFSLVECIREYSCDSLSHFFKIKITYHNVSCIQHACIHAYMHVCKQSITMQALIWPEFNYAPWFDHVRCLILTHLKLIRIWLYVIKYVVIKETWIWLYIDYI
jgi:hypothetical protein